MTRRVALVTGASRGIGAAIARRLDESGYALVLAARSAEPLAELAGTLREAIAVATDVSRPEQVTRLVAAALAAWGRIDVLVNNAGLAHVASVEDTPLERLDALMAVNFKGPFLCTQAVLPVMRAQGSGDILNILSIAAKRGFPGWSAYCASKAALDGFGRALSEELKGSGIRVSALYPGATDSTLWDALATDGIARAGMLQPEDVAHAVAFALSQPARARMVELVIEPARGDM